MRKLLLLNTILFLLFSSPALGMTQTFGGPGLVDRVGEPSPGLVNGGFHFHVNPAEDHPAFESLNRDTYQYEALHGYEHSRGEGLRQVDRFKEIQHPKSRPDSRPASDNFFGVPQSNPLKW